jgi:hypothetical protein
MAVLIVAYDGRGLTPLAILSPPLSISLLNLVQPEVRPPRVTQDAYQQLLYSIALDRWIKAIPRVAVEGFLGNGVPPVGGEEEEEEDSAWLDGIFAGQRWSMGGDTKAAESPSSESDDEGSDDGMQLQESIPIDDTAQRRGEPSESNPLAERLERLCLASPALHAAASYCLYTMHAAQPRLLARPDLQVVTKIRLDVAHQQALLSVVPLLLGAGYKEAAAILKDLHERGAFAIGARPVPAALGEPSQPGDGATGFGPVIAVGEGSIAESKARVATLQDPGLAREVNFHLNSTLGALGTSNLDKLCQTYKVSE